MNQNLPSADEVTLQDLWRVIWSRRLFVASLTFCFAVVLIVFVLLQTPIYRAEVLLEPVSTDRANSALGGLGQLGSLASIAGLSLNSSDDRKVEAAATLKSRALTEAFVNDEHLLPVLFDKKWDSANQRWRPMPAKDVPTLWDANKLFDRELRTVAEDKKTGLITLAIDWKDPVLAQQWVTSLVKRTNALLRERARERAERNIAYLQDQLNKTSVVEIRQAVYSLVENEIKTVMLAQSSEEYAFKVLDPAVIPEEKIKPKRVLTVAIGSFAGLLLACMIAVLRGPRRS